MATIGRNHLILAAAAVSGLVFTAPAAAQNEQFIPILSYRTGPYAVNGAPYANGVADYYSLINERDGGINGVKLLIEECETGYATDKGVECYERLKGKGPTGAVRNTGNAHRLIAATAPGPRRVRPPSAAFWRGPHW